MKGREGKGEGRRDRDRESKRPKIKWEILGLTADVPELLIKVVVRR